MRRRTCLLIALALAACSPPPAHETPPPAAQAAPVAPSPSAIPASPLAGDLAPGAWVFDEGNAGSTTTYGPPDSVEGTFFINCERGPKHVALSIEHTLAPDQDTTLTITTAAGAQTFAARSYNQQALRVTAELDAPDPRLSALAAATDRFSVSTDGETITLPMDETVKHTLALCGVE